MMKPLFARYDMMLSVVTLRGAATGYGSRIFSLSLKGTVLQGRALLSLCAVCSSMNSTFY